MKILSAALYTVAILGFSALPAIAQEWPAKQPIRLIVPYPAGGNADSAARAIAEMASKELKQVIVVDNRLGASSIIGSELVARAPADGYTIGVVSDSHAINQAMAKHPKSREVLGSKLPYDAERDFKPISGMILVPLVLVVNPKVGPSNLKDLVQFSKNGKKGGLNFGSMGPGSPWFIHMHQLNGLTSANFVDVPYKGLAPAANDLLAGQIDLMVMPVHYAQQYINSGKLLPIAVLDSQRHELLPKVPTLAESGYPGLNISNYLFFVAPAATPQPIVDKLYKKFNAVLNKSTIKEKLSASGDPYLADSKEISRRLNRDIEEYGEVIKKVIN